MEHWNGDFNISTLIRNANAFNIEKVYYLGKKKIDRRGSVGTHHYVSINYLDNDVHETRDQHDNEYYREGQSGRKPSTSSRATPIASDW